MGVQNGTNNALESSQQGTDLENEMKSILLGASALSLVLLASPVFAAPPDQPGHQSPAQGTTNDTMSAAKDAVGHGVGVVSAEMTSTTKGFVDAAAVSDMYEVEAGKIASERGQSASVKSFGAKMATAHTETTTKLKAALASTHPDITPPARLDDRRQGMIDELRGAKDADFDGRYIAQQIDAHKEALILMKGYAKDGDTPEIKKLAAKTAPIVQMHLSMAEKIQNGMKK
jgi:putative membrane protein